MFELLIGIVFIWLFIKVFALTFKVAWGVTKIIATILLVIALPILLIGLLFAGGIVLLIPFGLLAVAFGLVRND